MTLITDANAPVARSVPLPTGTFMEWDARVPGPVLVNMNRILYVAPDAQGFATLVFDNSTVLPLNDSYAAVAAAVLGEEA